MEKQGRIVTLPTINTYRSGIIEHTSGVRADGAKKNPRTPHNHHDARAADRDAEPRCAEWSCSTDNHHCLEFGDGCACQYEPLCVNIKKNSASFQRQATHPLLRYGSGSGPWHECYVM